MVSKQASSAPNENAPPAEVTDITLPKDVRSFVNSDKFHTAVIAAAPRGVEAKRLIRQMQTAINRNEQLANCSVVSMRDALMDVAQLGLDLTPTLGQAYLIPFGKVCTFILGYRGMVELMYRTGRVKAIRAVAVFKGDKFTYSRGLHEDMVHEPGPSVAAQDLTHVYVIVRIDGIDPIWDVMTRAEVDGIRKRSRSANNGPWVTDYVEMAKKTIVRRIAKLCPMLPDLHDALEVEDSQKQPDFIPAEFTKVEGEPASSPEAAAARVEARVSGGKRAAPKAAAPPPPPPAAPAGAPAERQEEFQGEEQVQGEEEQPPQQQGSFSSGNENELRVAIIGEIEGKIAKMKTGSRLVFLQQVKLDKKPLADRSTSDLSTILDMIDDTMKEKK